MEYPKIILEAIQKVYTATMHGVPKTGRNNHGGYNYASEDDVINKLKPVMNEAGLILMASTSGEARIGHGKTNAGKGNIEAYVTMEYTLAHVSGAVWPEKLYSEGMAMDTQDKAVAQAITSANKYFMLKFFMLATDQDPDRDKTDNSGPAASLAAVGDEELEMVCESLRSSKKDGTLNREWLNLLGSVAKPTPFLKRLTKEQIDKLRAVKAEGAK